MPKAELRIASFKHPLMENREVEKRAIIVVSSDRGLCGGLNGNLFREVASKLDKVKATRRFLSLPDARFLCSPLRAIVKRPYCGGIHLQRHADVCRGAGDLEICAGSVLKNEADAVDILYTKFVSTFMQQPTTIPFLPVGKIQAVTAGVNAPQPDARKVPLMDRFYRI